MKGKQVKRLNIIPPEGYEMNVDKHGIVTFKKEEEEPKIRTWDDLVKLNKNVPDSSCYISTDCETENISNGSFFNNEEDRNLFIDEKHAKSALAMAMISQLMPYYGGKISDEEWDEHKVVKYEIVRHFDETYRLATFDNDYYFLAFHTEEQQKDFLKYNEQLVKDYLMIE